MSVYVGYLPYVIVIVLGIIILYIAALILSCIGVALYQYLTDKWREYVNKD